MSSACSAAVCTGSVVMMATWIELVAPSWQVHISSSPYALLHLESARKPHP